MAKNSLYKKLVRQFESTINDYQAVNSGFDFIKFENILNQKKDKHYYSDIQQFLVYLKECKDINVLIFIFPKLRKEYQRLLDKIESLRPLEASRQIRSTNNCIIEDPRCYQYNDNLEITKYLDDLQKSPGFSEILKREQSVEFRFKDTIFILSQTCIRRQDLAKNSQSLCRSDYVWFFQSMAIYHIRKKVNTEAQMQGLSLNKAKVAQIIQDIYSIDPVQQNDRQLMGIDNNGTRVKINESELEQFIFNAEYLPAIKFTFSGRKSSNPVSVIDQAVKEIIGLKLKPEESRVITLPTQNHYSRPLPEIQSAISGVLQTDINTTSTTSHQSAEGFNWKIIVPVVVVTGIGIIVSAITGIIRYRNKFKSENVELKEKSSPLLSENVELKKERPSFLNSIAGKLHIQEITQRLDKRLEFLKDQDRYENEIGRYYTSFCSVKSKEEAIDNLKKIKEALTKFLEPPKTSNKDKILSKKLESVLLIVESLMQRCNLLFLSDTNTSKNSYIEKHKKTLKNLINTMLPSIEIIRDDFEGPFFKRCKIEKKDELKYLDLLLNVEKVIYETMLSAHAEEYFANYPHELVMRCLNLNIHTKPVEDDEIKSEDINKPEDIKLQEYLLSTLNYMLTPSEALSEELCQFKKKDEDSKRLYIEIKSLTAKITTTKSLISHYFTDSNARKEEANKHQKQTQASNGSGNPTFFRQPESAQIQPMQKFTMRELLLENPATQPSTYYRINRWAKPDIAWRNEEKVWLKRASSSYSFEIEADPNEITRKWFNYYYATKKDASIFGENCAVAVQRFLTHFANIPAPRKYNPSWNHLALGIMWPNFIPCPVMLPGLVMDNAKRHTNNALLQPTLIADLSESGKNEYVNEAINYLKQLNQSSMSQCDIKKTLIKFNGLNEFYCCLKDINEKANNLRMNGHVDVAKTADQLVSDLHSCALKYLKNSKNTAFEVFKSECFNHINLAKPVLKKHQGWKHLLMNLALAILGARVFYMAGINKKLNGKFTFFRDTSFTQKVNGISNVIFRLEEIENAMCSTPLSSRGL
ncbi:hypothetical protein FQR65_LT11277 [Abscondita terminalis]|nr:hypothetical protein FQR65_LT11277 [Abscondita terminalis]